MDNTYEEVLNYWFDGESLDSPKLDARMDLWFGTDTSLATEISERFGSKVEAALRGQLNDWAKVPQGRFALILLLDQFARRIYRCSKQAYAGDALALQLCAKGASNNMHAELDSTQRLFFFMPLQRAESEKIQLRSVKVYQAMAGKVSATMSETFETFAMIAELRHDVIAEFGRFPHRNMALGRETTANEAKALTLGIAA